ncbi:MAG: hypothetical protein HY718_04475 [Planctomycetes bacterium]|nr:hypothetical protein [Planctomycetota bacterium]
MARPLFKYRPLNPSRRGRVTQLRNVLPRHHMGRVNRAPLTRPVDTTPSGN